MALPLKNEACALCGEAGQTSCVRAYTVPVDHVLIEAETRRIPLCDRCAGRLLQYAFTWLIDARHNLELLHRFGYKGPPGPHNTA